MEVLVSLFIMAVGIAALFNLFPMGWQALAHSRKLNEVYLLAQKKLEELKTLESLEEGEKSGKEGDLNWALFAKSVKFQDGVTVIVAQLDVDFEFQKKLQKQTFVTYLTKR